MRYFGIIKEDDIIDLSKEDLLHYLGEKEIFETIFYEIEQLDKIELEKRFGENPEIVEKIVSSNLDFEISPPIKLIEEVNKFLYSKFKHKVLQKKIDFFEQFEEAIYGLEFQKAKEIGLNEFKKTYASLDIKSKEKTFEYEINKDIHLYVPTMLFKLYRFRLGFQIEKTTLEIILPYLVGNSDLYNREFYYQNKEIEQLISLELNIEIIRTLNSKFKFEKDIYFNNFFNYSLKEKCFDMIFKDFAYVFSMMILENSEEINRSKVESLYAFLEKNNLFVGKKEELMEVINLEFGTKINKIKNYQEFENRTHDERVNMLEIEWEYFKKEYVKFDK